MEKLKLFEMFSGYGGGGSFSLIKARIPFECVGYSEIDKYAIQCYNQNFPRIENFGDCKMINPERLPDFDLLTGGFPCQAFSVAGKRKGESDPRGTLFYDIIRIAEVKKPKYMLLENVKGLTNKTFKDTFNKILNELDRIGYNVYWKVLNSKDFGIPQSRARVFFVCFRKDIDEPLKFQFPEPEPLKVLIEDILEGKIDEKYFLSEKLQQRFRDYMDKKVHSLYPRTGNPNDGGTGHLAKDDGTIYAIDTGNNQAIVEVFELGRKDWRKHNNLIPTLKNRMGTGGNNVPMVRDRGKFRELKNIANSIDSCDHKTYDNHEQRTLISEMQKGLRKLTPKECFRLMGFLNDEINLDGLADTQKYKLAGNGWEINLVSKIFRRMFN